jgi:tetratricopeptide (TPR) repeat protein
MAQNRGAGGPGATLPEGHPPIGRFELPAVTREFIAGLAAEAAKQPRDTMAWERLSEVQRRAARVDRSYYPEALKSYRHVLELNSENTTALRGLASIHYDLGEYDNARPYLEKYLALMPDDPAAQTDLATVRLRLGDVEQAIATYREVIAGHPRFVQAYVSLAATLHQMGDDSEALEALRQAKEVARDEPTRAEINRLMAKLDENPNATEDR